MAGAGILARFLGAVKIGRLYLGHVKHLTAASTQTQAAAKSMKGVINFFSTVGADGDGGKLPVFEESKVVIVVNGGSHSLKVYSKETSGVTIGATAGSTGISLAAGKIAIFFAATAGRWDTLVGA